MVCFARHAFTFPVSAATWRFALLRKYYRGTQIKVTVLQLNKASMELASGRLDKNFLSQLPAKIEHHKLGSNAMLRVVTDTLWSELACIHCLPRRDATHCLTIPQQSKITRQVTEQINGLIARRTGNNNDIFLRCDFPKSTDWRDVLAAIRQLKSPNITREFISEQDKLCVLVLNDKHPIKVVVTGCSDASLPTLDLDDGFAQNTFGCATIPSDFPVAFAQWKQRLDITNGASWQEDIM